MITTIAVLLLAAPPPKIERPMPTVFRRGTVTRFVLRGAHLAAARRITFDGAPGMAATIEKKSSRELRIALDVAHGAALGTRELRVVAASGVSNARRVVVSALPVHPEREPNDTNEAAETLRLPAVVCGTVHAATEVDRFAFDAAGGRSLVFDVHAARLGSRLDARLTVEDGRGRAVAWGETQGHGDPLLVFRPKTGGRFVLVVQDLRYGGSPEAFYRIRAGELPHVAAVFPLGGRAGGAASIELTGINLGERTARRIDLDGVPAGRRSLRLETGAGPSNELAFEVGASAERLEVEPNDARKTATPVELPAIVNGRIGRPGDCDWYRFEVGREQTLVIETVARRLGSRLDALLSLYDGSGKRLANDDDGARPDARIKRACTPGTYLVAVRDVTRRGGPQYGYRLRIGPAREPAPSFEVRFLPDAVRVARGGHTRLWCEARRLGGFREPVDVRVEGLPAGVRCSPVRLGAANAWTSVFTLTAARDAALGAHPVRVIARTSSGVAPAVPEDGGRRVTRAWVSVHEPSPFTVAPLGDAGSDDRQRYRAERSRLEALLREPSPEVARGREEWAFGVALAPGWIAVGDRLPVARSEFKRLDDGSFLAAGKAPIKDTYRLEAEVDLARIGAVRLDVLPDPSLPKRGPGRHGINGNFVLSRFTVTCDGKPVRLVRPSARFSQPAYEVSRAIDGNPATGWATFPQTGRSNWAVFELAEPVTPRGTARLVFELDQQYGLSHLIGRFRVSVAERRLPVAVDPIPAAVARLVRLTERTAEQEARLRSFYATVSPVLRRARQRIAQIDAGRGNQVEIDRLRKRLAASTPELAAAQERWERVTAERLTAWRPLAFTVMKSELGVRFEKEPRNVVRVARPIGPKDNYSLVAAPVLGRITALRLEALPGKPLPGGGPGLAPNGNFVLTDISVSAWPAGAAARVAPVAFTSSQASFTQRGFAIGRTLDGSHRTGWAILGNTGKASYAMWRLRAPLAHAAGTVLRVSLEHQSGSPNHLLGRFRLSVTSSAEPRLDDDELPTDVVQALVTAPAARNAAQTKRLADYYRSIAPALAETRARITRLLARQHAFPPRVRRGAATALAVRLSAAQRAPVTLTLEGFRSGRDKSGRPNAITKNVATRPVVLRPGQTLALLELKPSAKSELGTRAIVVRAAAEIGGESVVEYSAPIPLTVSK